jgi:hypothetical protein
VVGHPARGPQSSLNLPITERDAGLSSFQDPGSGGFPAPLACSTDEGPVFDGPLRCCTFASMGFLDKAKKLAEQAQTKLDEVQGQFNTQQGSGASSGQVTEYDKHGRPAPPAGGEAATMGSVAPPEAAAPATPGVPPTGSPATPPVEAAPSAPPPPPAPGVPAAEDDRNFPGYAPPPLTSGDPLAG